MTTSVDIQNSRSKRYLEQGLREALLIVCLTVSAYLVLALVSYDPADPSFFSTGHHTTPTNSAGTVGAYVSDLLLLVFGHVAFLFPFLFFAKAIQLFRHRKGAPRVHWPIAVLRIVGLIWLVLATCTLLALYSVAGLGPEAGGTLGQWLATAMVGRFNLTGSTLLSVALLLIGFSLATGLSWLKIMDWVGAKTLSALGATRSFMNNLFGSAKERRAEMAELRAERKALAQLERDQKEAESARLAALVEDQPSHIGGPQQGLLSGLRRWLTNLGKSHDGPDKRVDTALASAPDHVSPRAEVEAQSRTAIALLEDKKSSSKGSTKAAPAEKEVKIQPFEKKSSGNSKRAKKDAQPSLFNFGDGPLPSFTLLDAPDPHKKAGFSKEALQKMSGLLEDKLADFGVIAEVVEVNPGPVITRFEIQPAPGVKVSRISNLAKDLARSLAVLAVRVVEVIPGKSVVGIEIPNENRQMVRLREVISSKEYDDSDSPLSLALGNDIAGNPVVENLAKMPHLLVAGTTGSGKSVGVNAMLLSMLFKATPEELRLIMIDPKMLELSIYDGIPHLLTPVVTDMKEAANALRWCVGEMERRYRLMANLGVRNVAGYNKKVKDAISSGAPIKDPLWQPSDHALEETPPDLGPLPFIVVVVDEFADMMMIVGKKVEELIARIAQKARAAGIHLILATQRPSVDVITGLIKANVPTRIAFQVSSKIDSRTILDQGGAEQLLGHGDMLYMPPGTGLPIRVHGAFVDDDEVHRLVEDWKSRGEPDYLDEIIDGASDSDFVAVIDGAGGGEGGSEQDELFDEAVAFVTESRRASISAVQRRLKIGYNRAANLVEAMEAAGVVSAAGHNGAREVLAPPPPKD